MASRMIGRAECPECGFASAHVKESDKCLYRYCPECSSQHHAKTERQRADLMKKTRLVEPAPGPAPTPSEAKPAPAPAPADPAPTPTPTPTQPSPTEAKPKQRRLGLFGQV